MLFVKDLNHRFKNCCLLLTCMLVKEYPLKQWIWDLMYWLSWFAYIVRQSCHHLGSVRASGHHCQYIIYQFVGLVVNPVWVEQHLVQRLVLQNSCYKLLPRWIMLLFIIDLTCPLVNEAGRIIGLRQQSFKGAYDGLMIKKLTVYWTML